VKKRKKSKSLACTKTEVDSHNCENNIATIFKPYIFKMLVRLNVKDTTSREGKKGKRNIVKIKKDDQIYEPKTWHFNVGRFF